MHCSWYFNCGLQLWSNLSIQQPDPIDVVLQQDPFLMKRYLARFYCFINNSIPIDHSYTQGFRQTMQQYKSAIQGVMSRLRAGCNIRCSQQRPTVGLVTAISWLDSDFANGNYLICYLWAWENVICGKEDSLVWLQTGTCRNPRTPGVKDPTPELFWGWLWRDLNP